MHEPSSWREERLRVGGVREISETENAYNMHSAFIARSSLDSLIRRVTWFLLLALLVCQSVATDCSIADASGSTKRLVSPIRRAVLDTAANNCIICPDGTSSESDFSNCTSSGCPTGFCMNVSQCSPCLPGTYSNVSGAAECSSCPCGYVTGQQYSTSCQPCARGLESNSNNQFCTPCEPGTFNNNTGAMCRTCGLGTYAATYSSLHCDPCDTGTYNDKVKQASCTPCGEGRYNSFRGSKSISDCIKCPAGSYCPWVNTELPMTCPAESYCPEGIDIPILCSSMTTSSSGATDCHLRSGTYVIIGILSGIALMCIAIVALLWWRCRVKKAQTELVSRLIPEPTGPVYGGY